MSSDTLQFGPPPRAPLSRRTTMIVAGSAAVVILAGATILGVAIFRDSGPSTADVPAGVVLANDGKTQLAQLGTVAPLKAGDPQLAVGNIVNQVYAELAARSLAPKDLRTGGYRITTTIDAKAQKLLEQYARPDLTGSQLAGRTVVTGTDAQDLESAGVVVDHTTGRVLAYYGGIDAAGTDLAGSTPAARTTARWNTAS